MVIYCSIELMDMSHGLKKKNDMKLLVQHVTMSHGEKKVIDALCYPALSIKEI